MVVAVKGKTKSERRRRTPRNRTSDPRQARRRLEEQGLDGLGIVEVARDAGMSHATLLHHFGSAEGMRLALIDSMASRLIRDVVKSIRADDPADVIFEKLFATFTKTNHANLIAWRALNTSMQVEFGESFKLFDELIDVCAEPTGNREEARNLVMLVAATSIGFGVSGEVLKRRCACPMKKSNDSPPGSAGASSVWRRANSPPPTAQNGETTTFWLAVRPSSTTRPIPPEVSPSSSALIDKPSTDPLIRRPSTASSNA